MDLVWLIFSFFISTVASICVLYSYQVFIVDGFLFFNSDDGIDESSKERKKMCIAQVTICLLHATELQKCNVRDQNYLYWISWHTGITIIYIVSTILCILDSNYSSEIAVFKEKKKKTTKSESIHIFINNNNNKKNG